MNVIFYVLYVRLTKRINKKECIGPTNPLIYEDLIPIIQYRYDFALDLSLISCFQKQGE
jgi:hypothetical protein